MFLDVPLIADIVTLTRCRQAKIDNRLVKENAKRTRHECKVGQQRFVKVFDRDNKMSLVRTGPHPVAQVHANNTVAIQHGPLHERVSVRHVIPHKPSQHVLVVESASHAG